MKGISGWGYTPYRPYDSIEEAMCPFVCRIAPGLNTVELEWFDKGASCGHVLRYRLMNSGDAWIEIPADDAVMCVNGLRTNTDYEFLIVRLMEQGATSSLRYARTGHVPGTVVNYLHPMDMTYAFSGRALCSPSLVKLPSGALIASMDVFAGDQPQNLTLLFRSDDQGETWRYVTDLFPCYWATLFYHRDRLYIQSCSTEYGDIMLGYSQDEGRTWTKPIRLFSGSSSNKASGWQRTPMPMLIANGRIYVSADYGTWGGEKHAICVLSAPEDCDLMQSENWCVSDLTRYNPGWDGAPEGPCAGLLEGSMVISPAGELLDILRIQMYGCKPDHGMAAVLRSNWEDPEEKQTFVGFTMLPSGANSKTHILRDPIGGKYYAIGNIVVNDAFPLQRNVLALQVSSDLVNWRISKILLDYRHEDPVQVGFQYISFIFDGDDILYLSRTSINGAKNYHDANYQTFHTIKNFRELDEKS